MKSVCYISFVLLLSFSAHDIAWAQAPDSTFGDPGYDTSYIKSFRDNLVVTLISATCVNNISVKDNNGKDIVFATNLPTSYGLGLDYKWLTAEYASSFGRTGPVEKGNTQMQHIGFGLTTRKFWFKNFYQNTQGYYLTNPNYFDPSFDPSKDYYPFRNDVRSSVYYATLNYGFNARKFSNIASVWQLERQKKSAGSITVGLTFSMADYASDSALFPRSSTKYFPQEEAITDFKFRMYGLNAGYLHTFPFTKSRKFFLSITMIPGVSFQQGESSTANINGQVKKQAIGAHMESRVVLGYNGDRWYASATAMSYVISSAFENINPFSQGYSFGRVAIGYKFKMKETKSPFLKKFGL